ncbi:MAG TPA: YggT family protein [Dehalococcoidia bacterium]|nr:YggT family protein [Dehalococcoidia bacterium]
MNSLLYNFVAVLTQILTLAIFVRAILSWFPISRDNPFVEVIVQITDPILGPIRRVIPLMGSIDFSPLVAIILLQMISSVVEGLIR